MTVDLVGCAHHGGIGAVLFVPDAVTHYGDGRRTLHVVGIGHQPADPGLHAEGREEIAGHILTVACVGGRREPARRTPSGALPACSAARSTNSGVWARKFLYASQENREKSPSSPCRYPPQLQQRTLSPILQSSSGSSPAAISASPGGPA